MTTLPLLDCVMRHKRASNEALATVSGVSARTIQKARKGGAIQPFLAQFISEALYKNEFNGTGHVNNWRNRITSQH